MRLKEVIFRLWRKVYGSFSDNGGFTLGELMSVVAVFTIVASIGVPTFLSSQPGRRLNGGARQVFAKLMWARSQAVMQNTTYIVTFPTNHTLQIYNDANGNSALDGGEWNETVDIQAEYSDVTFTISGSSSTPRFTGRGTASSDTTVTLGNSSGSKQVKVTATGNVTIS